MKFSAERQEIDKKTVSNVVEKKLRFGRREPSFDTVTMSMKPSFLSKCKETGKDAFQELKRNVELVMDCLYRFCEKFFGVFGIWYRVVIYEGLPHLHGLFFTDCQKVKRELSRQWSKHGLGYGEFITVRERGQPPKVKRGNVLFEPVYDLGRWLSYMHCKKNQYGTRMKRRVSYNGGQILRNMSPWDVLDLYSKKAKLSIFLRAARAGK